MSKPTTITSAPGAPLGTLTHLSTYGRKTFPSSSVILCRQNAPLITFCYGLIQRDLPCRIAGREIGAQLEALVKRFKAGSLEELTIRIREWRDAEVSRALASDRSPEHYLDQAEALLFLTKDADSIDHILARIRRLFDAKEAVGQILLSTIHKAKGGEWRDVFLLDFGLMPSRFAKTRSQLQQEKNLQYVAVTRSLANLTYLQSDCWED